MSGSRIFGSASETRGAASVVLLGFVALILYWISSSTVYPATGDGLSEWQLALHPAISRPNHLLLTSVFLAAHEILTLLGLDVSLLRTMVLTNVVSGALAVVIWGELALLLGLRRQKLVLGGFVLVVSSVWWLHSREPESAMLSQLLFMMAVMFVFFARRRPQSGATLNLLAGGIACGIAVLLSLNLIVFVPVFLILVPSAGGFVRWARNATVWGVAAALTAAPWFLQAYSQAAAGSGETFFAWLTAHPTGEMMGVVGRGFSPLGVLRAPIGLARCFQSLDSGVPTAVKMLLTGQGGSSPSLGALGLFAMTVALSLVLLVSAFRALSYRGGQWASAARAIVIGLVISLVVNSYWLGSDPQFWLPIYPLLLLSALVVWQKEEANAEPRLRRLLFSAGVSAGIVLLVVNISWPVPTIGMPGGGKAWATARIMAGELQKNTLFLASDSQEALYVKYYDPSIERVNLLYDIQGHGETYKAALMARIVASQRVGDDVVTEGVKLQQKSAEQGMWENMKIVRGYDQAGLLIMLGREFELRPLTAISGYPMIQIGRPRGAPLQDE